MRKTLLAIAVMAMLDSIASVMKSTPTGAQAPDATVSVLKLMSQAVNLPVAPAYDAI